MPLPPLDKHPNAPRILLWPLEALVAFFIVLEGFLTPLLRPLAQWILKLEILARLEEIAQGLPPYGILAFLAVPFAFAEPAKLYSLYLIGTGHSATGAVLLALAHLLTLVVVERLYLACEAKLRTIPWFAALMDWLIGIRDRLLEWARSTRFFASAVKVRQHVGALSVQVMAKVRGLLDRLRFPKG